MTHRHVCRNTTPTQATTPSHLTHFVTWIKVLILEILNPPDYVFSSYRNHSVNRHCK